MAESLVRISLASPSGGVDIRAYRVLGEVCYKLHKMEDAIRAYEQVCDGDDGVISRWLNWPTIQR